MKVTLDLSLGHQVLIFFPVYISHNIPVILDSKVSKKIYLLVFGDFRGVVVT